MQGQISLPDDLSLYDEIINALRGFSIVKDVIPNRNTLVITADAEQWVLLDTILKDVFTKTVCRFVNAHIPVKDIYLKNTQGETLACLQQKETRNNHMGTADRETNTLETEKEQEAPFDLERALSTDDTPSQNTEEVSAEGAEKSASHSTHQKDIPDIPSKEFAPESTPSPAMKQPPKFGALYISIVFLAVIIAGTAGYYFSFKKSAQTKLSFVLPRKIAPLRIPATPIDKKNQALKLTVQTQKAVDDRQAEPTKKDLSQPVAEKAPSPASRVTAPPAHTASTAGKETKPVQPAPAVALVEKKPAQTSKKVSAPLQKKALDTAPQYCVNVSLCKMKESADVVVRDLQKKGFEPAVDTITVKNTPWYRVTLGHFKTQDEAQNYAGELQRKGKIDGFVVKKK